MNKVVSSSEDRSKVDQSLHYEAGKLLQPASDEDESKYCVACRAAGRANPAIGHTSHPEYRQLALCAECISHYDNAVIE